MGASVEDFVGGRGDDRRVDFVVGDVISGWGPHGPGRDVGIPYQGGELPGHLFLVDDGGGPRPTVVYTDGFDARRDAYRMIGGAALRYGYNFLVYDGPGQGAMLGERGVPCRPDWENVLGPVVDYASTVPEIADDGIVQFGSGLGSYLVARHASRDHRSAAIVCNDAMTTFYAARPPIPESILELVEDGRDAEAMRMLDDLAGDDAEALAQLQHGKRVFGTGTTVEYVRRTADFTLTANDVRNITTPALILEDEEDTAFAGQAANFARAMTAPVRHVVMHETARHLLHQTVFGWLDTQLLPVVASCNLAMT